MVKLSPVISLALHCLAYFLIHVSHDCIAYVDAFRGTAKEDIRRKKCLKRGKKTKKIHSPIQRLHNLLTELAWVPIQ